MKNIKHVGKISSTNSRCVVVFRHIYDANGNIADRDNCLIFESDRLPDAEHGELIKIVESETAQSTGDLFNVLSRTRLGNGNTALQWLASQNRLRKIPTKDVHMIPTSTMSIPLNKLNRIIELTKSGMSQAEIENVIANENDKTTEMPQIDNRTDSVLDDESLAASYISQAEMFESQAAELRNKAKELQSKEVVVENGDS
jgi:hypothetical protein